MPYQTLLQPMLEISRCLIGRRPRWIVGVLAVMGALFLYPGSHTVSAEGMIASTFNYEIGAAAIEKAKNRAEKQPRPSPIAENTASTKASIAAKSAKNTAAEKTDAAPDERAASHVKVSAEASASAALMTTGSITAGLLAVNPPAAPFAGGTDGAKRALAPESRSLRKVSHPFFTLDDPEQITRLRVTVHKSQTIRFARTFGEALVSESEIADVIPLTDRSLYVVGKKIGATRLSILDKEKQLLGIVELEVSYDTDALNAQLRRSVPGANIRVTSVNGRILLSGYVPNAPALEKAVAIAEQYAPESVTNSLSVAGSQQVLLEVRFVEASRAASRNLGVSWDLLKPGSFDARTNLPGGVGLGAFPRTVLPFGSLVARLLNGGTSADLLIQALEEKGLARRLAEPNLVALSGDTASFLAGGEFPFPIAREDNTITIEFKKFGVGLGFTPTVLANGLINLKIEPEVSEIDPNNTLVVNDTTIPGLVTRRAKTTIELRDGQSFAIAGLLQANHTKAHKQLPWIGQVPVLGALFRSASYEKKETDLVIIVTPRLVQPAGPGDRLVTPFDNRVPSNDVGFFLNGKQEQPNWKARERRQGPAKRRVPISGHMLSSASQPGVGPKSKAAAKFPKYKADPVVTGALPRKNTVPAKRRSAKKAASAKKLKPAKETAEQSAAPKTGLLSGILKKVGIKNGLFGRGNVASAESQPRGNLSFNMDGGA